MTLGVHIPVRPQELALVFSDLHFKTEDKRFCDILHQVAQDLKPHLIIANGDIHDCAALSKHDRRAKDQVDGGALAREAEASKPFLDAMRAASILGGRCIYGVGNHEARWDRFVNEHPGLYGLEWWTPYESAVSEWELFPPGYELYLGPLTICHGDDLTGAISRHSTASVMASYPRENILYGHTHRIERRTETLWTQGIPHEHGVWTTGHGQDVREVDWTARTRWRLGFAVVMFWKLGRGLGFTVEQHEVFRTGRGLTLYSPLTGKVYKA